MNWVTTDGPGHGTQRLDVRQGEAAVKRAAAKARMLGKHTGTPVFVLRDGKVVDLTAEAARGRRTDFEKYLAAIPNVAPPGNDRLD
jgi:hypothetical protein